MVNDLVAATVVDVTVCYHCGLFCWCCYCVRATVSVTAAAGEEKGVVDNIDDEEEEDDDDDDDDNDNDDDNVPDQVLYTCRTYGEATITAAAVESEE